MVNHSLLVPDLCSSVSKGGGAWNLPEAKCQPTTNWIQISSWLTSDAAAMGNRHLHGGCGLFRCLGPDGADSNPTPITGHDHHPIGQPLGLKDGFRCAAICRQAPRLPQSSSLSNWPIQRRLCCHGMAGKSQSAMWQGAPSQEPQLRPEETARCRPGPRLNHMAPVVESRRLPGKT